MFVQRVETPRRMPRVAEVERARIGWDCWIESGQTLPDETIALLERHGVGLEWTNPPEKLVEVLAQHPAWRFIARQPRPGRRHHRTVHRRRDRRPAMKRCTSGRMTGKSDGVSDGGRDQTVVPSDPTLQSWTRCSDSPFSCRTSKDWWTGCSTSESVRPVDHKCCTENVEMTPCSSTRTRR